MIHKLKILECYADAKYNGDKLFEVRYNNDRGFQKGDIVKYEVCTVPNGIKKRIDHPLASKEFEITYVTAYKQQSGCVVFGEKDVTAKVPLKGEQK